MKLKTMLQLAAIVTVTAMLSTGCSIFNKKEGAQAIDPPPTGADSVLETASVPVSAVDGRQVTLYYKDTQNLVAPVTVYIPKTVEVAKKSLEYMVAGGPGEAGLPNGFQALLPEGTTIKGINLKADEKLAIVDFSKEFNNYKEEDERKILEAVVWTLTELETIDQVSIRVEGNDVTQMALAKTPVDSALTRAMGINLEFSSGLNLGQSIPVTLYFQSRTADEYSYYVPVTRLVQRTDNIAKAAVEELIKGPGAGRGLASVISEDTALLQAQLSQDNSVVTIDLDDKLLGSDQLVPAGAAQALILSLTESTGVSKVQLMVNGDAKLSGSDQTSYSKPVEAPAYINPAQL